MLAKDQTRIAVIVLSFIVLSVGSIWLVFGQHLPSILEQNRVFYSILALALFLPTLFYYSIAKRMRRFAIGLSILSAGLLLLAAGTLIHFVFDLNNVWNDYCFNAGEACLALASVVFVWQGVRESRARKATEMTDE
jgi:uncharacterized membrane protein YoaT (DUF817 family)